MEGPNPNPFEMNWKQFEQFFGGKLPFGGHAGVPGSGEGMAWVENYVKDVLRQSMPAAEAPSIKHHFHSELFDTHKSVIVKVHIPDRAQARQLRLMLSASEIRLENLPDNNSQTIRLASPVVPGSCKAVYRHGVLQLHLRKQASDHLFHEIDIRFT
ncbi:MULTISPECIES: Hsp20/alpha crystallin family protein [Paenibacillus]|uniref:Hsp20/alpha crystallin family protein n=1 Tax=Paenibacillus TaxID=44249 RepID=UPI0022B8F49C|nr:Hsp20/alpha crystallin family protein [Paenibacillus caseinilyticus]MCZ8518838.1 Hsp20/alpha crystallin family protein [Paenibacillus caseinilyticus]